MIEELKEFKEGEILFNNGDFKGAELCFKVILTLKKYS